MSYNEIAKSLELLEKDWEIDSVIKDFHLVRRDDVSENSIKIGDVVFHIPFLTKIKNLFFGNVIGQTVQTAAQGKVDFL